MSQTATQSEDRKERTPTRGQNTEAASNQRRQAAYDRSQGYRQVISSDAQIYFILATVMVILLLVGVISVGAYWVFPPIYVGVVISYISGALYLFKKLWTQ
jgi:hypothetical protein